MDPAAENTDLSIDVDAIVSVLDNMPITAAVLYGSHARREATDHSDIDLAVMFDDSLSSVERTKVRLSLIEQLSRALKTNNIDVVPLPEAPSALRREIKTDGIVLYGSSDVLSQSDDDVSTGQTHDDRMARFDELLTEIEQVV